MYYYNVHSILNLIASIFCLLTGLFVYSKGRKSEANASFFILTIAVAIWKFGDFMLLSSSDPAIALLWCRNVYLGSVFISIATYHFSVAFLHLNEQKKYVLPLYLIGLFIWVPLSRTTFFVMDVRKYYWGYWYKSSYLFLIYLAFFGFLMFCSFYNFYKSYKSCKSPIEKTRIRYLLIAFIVAYIGTVEFLPNYGIAIYPFGHVVLIAYIFIFAYAILRYQLMDIEVVIKKTIIFSGLLGLLYAIIAAITFVAKNVIGHYVIVSQNMATLIIITIILLLDAPLKKILINLTENFLFQKEYDHQELFDIMSQSIMGKVDLRELKTIITKVTMDTLKLENAIIIEQEELNDNAIIDKQLKPGISIPIFLNKEIYWMLFLGEKKSGKAFTKEDENMLKSFSRDITMTIEIAKTQMELMRQENLKFVSVLVKGLAHEIFNPLTPLMHRIEDLEGEEMLAIYEIYENNSAKFSKDERAKFKEAILGLRNSTKLLKANAEHIRLIVDTLNKLEKGDDKTIGPVDIKTFLKEVFTVSSFEVDADLQKEVIINQNIDKNLPPVNGNPTLLKQVFINLYKNACEAMRNSEVKTIDISCKTGGPNKNELLIEFSDTGPGIPPEILKKLFTYGVTTKGTSGSGIGLNQAKAMIEKFGGFIKVESQKNKGTKFIIGLPVSTETTEEVKNVG